MHWTEKGGPRGKEGGGLDLIRTLLDGRYERTGKGVKKKVGESWSELTVLVEPSSIGNACLVGGVKVMVGGGGGGVGRPITGEMR